MSGIAGLYDGMDINKVMYGQDAFQIPLNMISQEVEGEKVAGVFQTSMGLPLRFNSKRTHVLILGDLVFRPRIVIASDHLRGYGFAGIARDGFADIDEWLKHGDIIISPNNEELAAHGASLRRRNG